MWLFYLVALLIVIVMFWGFLSSLRNVSTYAGRGLELQAAKYAADHFIKLTEDEKKVIADLKKGL